MSYDLQDDDQDDARSPGALRTTAARADPAALERRRPWSGNKKRPAPVRVSGVFSFYRYGVALAAQQDIKDRNNNRYGGEDQE